ncbi:MAG TPA: hypothetical protein DDX89_02520 [Candidatus Omnitrophica bacterium]|nr:hypothetical protein [Candidatus Omnitrophota bacterium]
MTVHLRGDGAGRQGQARQQDQGEDPALEAQEGVPFEAANQSQSRSSPAATSVGGFQPSSRPAFPMSDT